jgi:hypothetical protein
VNVLFRSAAGPIEGFTTARFRVAVNDDGTGVLVGLPDVIDPVAGTITCSVDGVEVFAWKVEERSALADDRAEVTVSGRGPAGALERAIVLPDGYPAFTVRTRTLTGAPFAIWSTLLGEAQGRGRLPGVTPTWTATEDSNGDPWTTTVTVQLDPGVNLRQLLDEVGEVEGAEWIVRPDLTVEAAPQIGTDRSGEVVLFVGRDQVSRGRRESSRRQRQTVYLEASTGVSEVTNFGADPDAGEIWLEGQDFADPLTRPIVAGKIADSLADPDVEVDVIVAPDCGVFDRFNVGDLIGLDTGSGTPEVVRVVGASIEVGDTVRVELTLISEVALRQQQIDRAIEAKADVQLAASTTFQRRHGLVTADKFLSGAVGSEVAISSENFVPAVPGPGEGWAIFGNGNAEFNDAIFRGDLQSDNYVPGVSGWFLDRDGNAEFEQGDFRGVVTTEGDIIIPPGAPAPGLGEIRARSIVDAGRTIYEIGLGAYPQTSFFEAGSIFADPTDTVDVGGERQVGSTDLVGLGLAQQEGAAFLTGLKDETQAIGPWRFVPDVVRGSTSGVTLTSSPFVADASSPLTLSTTATTSTLLTANGRAVFNQRVTINNEALTQNLTALVGNTYNIDGYRNITGNRDVSAGRDLFAFRNTILSGQLTVFGSSLFAAGDFNGNVGFRITTSGAFFTMNQAGTGSQGGEPTLDTSNDLFGFSGTSARRLFRSFAGAFLTSSESRLKGELVDADLTDCYEKVRDMRLTRYSLHRDRDAYYIAKGEAILAGDDFDDPGGPLPKLGIVAEEAPDEVADEEHRNIDIYAYASLIAGAVKKLQEKVEALEAARE